ncbi:MAG: nickel pincer cofactor biosynthesis protein LarC [Methanomicrobiales archaeon]|nr:nickel pincer cofactor biosynthesis protein LarC [Methanomicrobiales archaeon]
MQILLFDPFSGAAGDMIVGALLDAGADPERVSAAMAAVVAAPTFERVDRRGIAAVKVATHAERSFKTLAEVQAVIEGAGLPAPVREMAGRVFARIWQAETRIHGGHAHFHEVGADDAIADVIGACTALDSLAPDGVAVLPVRLGRGVLAGSHGSYPVPAPATLAVLADGGLSVIQSDEPRELCTPTGAALLAEFATLSPDALGACRILAVGYGAGSRDPAGLPNVLRVSLLDAEPPAGAGDTVDVLETNVDDVTGEVLAHALDVMMEAGARDAAAAPILMKKGRPGHLVRVICCPSDGQRLAALLASELGSLGVRCISSVHRHITPRSMERVAITVAGRDYDVDVKIGWEGEKAVSCKPEFEQVRRIAKETGVSLRAVSRTAEAAGWALIAGRGR